MSTHMEISQLITKTQTNFNKTNFAECLNQSMKYLKLTETNDEKEICLKLITNQGAWKCKDCQKNKESIYCNECWGNVKEKHIQLKHNYEYISNYICGTCDCGNLNNMGKDFICSKHKKNPEENRSENISDKKEFQNIHKELFSQMANYIADVIDKNETNNECFVNNIKSFIDYISSLSFTNIKVLNWIAELLLKNYQVNNKNSNHKCINISYIYSQSRRDFDSSWNYHRRGSQKDIFPIINNCSCPFLRYLMSVWQNNKDKIDKTLMRFSQNYELKIYIGILYLFLYDELIIKEKNDFSSLRKEFLFSEIRKIISKHKNLLDKLLNSPVLIIKKFGSLFDLKEKNNSIDNNPENLNKKYKSLKKVINNLKFDILNVLCEETKTDFISEDAKFYLSLIDILVKFHNINSIKWEFDNNQKETQETYNGILLQTELSLLDIFTTMTSIIDFENNDLIGTIFLYFNEKISKKEFRNLKKDEYSYHITLFRGFSIFLNRYCFFYANKYDSDVTKGFESVKDLMPDFDECIKILFLEVSKLFRFFAACGEDLFIYYGQSMKNYETTYYYTYKFVYRDFSLMKYLIPNGSVKEFFSGSDNENEQNGDNNFSSIIKTILLLKEKSNKSVKEILEKGNNLKFMKIISRLLSIALSIIRNNGSLIWNLGSSFKSLKSCQIEDTLLTTVIDKDLDNMKELAKALIINKAIVEENSASFSELLNGIYYILRETMGEEELEKMINDMFYSTKSKDQKEKYSIKDDYLSNIDTNYILSPAMKAKAEKYLFDFKKNKISAFNRCFYNVNQFETVLTEKIYTKIFWTEKSMDFILDSIIKLIKNEEYVELRPYFLNTLLNYFDIFYSVDFQNFTIFRNSLNKKINTFIETISVNNLEEPYKLYCDLIIKKVKGNKIEEEDKTEKQNMEKEISQRQREKMKLKNKKFLNKINLNFNDDKKSDENELQKMLVEPEYGIFGEQCIFCKNYVNELDFGNCFGKICYLLLDKFSYNASIKVVKNLYISSIQKNGSLLNFNNLFDPKKEKARKNLRILSCGHTVHFSCFFNIYMQNLEKITINNFLCPICKKYGNTFIPQINHIFKEKIIDKNIYDLFKGYDLNFVLNYRNKYGKNIKKFFEEKNKKMEEEKEKDKSEIYLLSEDIYKKPGGKNKDVNVKNMEEQRNFLKKNYNNIFIACRHLIEGFFGVKEEFYTDFNLEAPRFIAIQKDSLLYCFLQFRDFTDYFIKSDKKDEQIYLWKNLFLSFRLMLKVNILRDNFFVNFNLLLYRMCNLDKNKNIPTMINNDQFNIILSGILFLLCVFFEYEEVEGYEKYIIYLFLPVYSFAYYFRKLYLNNSLTFGKEDLFNKNSVINERAFINKMNEKNFFEFLKTDNSSNSLKFILKKLVIVNYLLKNKDEVDKGMFETNNIYESFNLPQLKQKNIIQILDELEIIINNEKNLKNDQMEISDEEPKETIYNIFFQFFNNNNNKKNRNIYNHKNIFNFLIKEFTNEIKKNSCPQKINPNLLSFCKEINYNFIPLQKYAVEFLFENYKLSCEQCKRRGKVGLICLDCGKKVTCKNEENLQNNNNNININNINGDNPSNLDLFYKHVELCGGGTGVFLYTLNFNVTFVQNKKISKTKIPLYLDKHGESIKEKSIHNGFCLNEAQLKKAKKILYNNDLIFY